MKKYIYRILPILFAGFFAAAFNGCILDAINSFPINVPLSFEFFTAGTSSNLTASDTLILGENPTYNEYSSNINNITFLEIIFRTDSVSSGLKGDLTVTVTQGTGGLIPLISEAFSGITPADYMNKPLKISLTDEEKNALNNYLNNSNIPPGEKTFIGTINIHVTNGSSPYFIHGYVDIAIQMDTNL